MTNSRTTIIDVYSTNTENRKELWPFIRQNHSINKESVNEEQKKPYFNIEKINAFIMYEKIKQNIQTNTFQQSHTRKETKK